jgi:hypothetical protein
VVEIAILKTYTEVVSELSVLQAAPLVTDDNDGRRRKG